jgi:Endoplasmic Reticulum Oxidoreductin 1 (ERO1)/FAD binding domain
MMTKTKTPKTMTMNMMSILLLFLLVLIGLDPTTAQSRSVPKTIHHPTGLIHPSPTGGSSGVGGNGGGTPTLPSFMTATGDSIVDLGNDFDSSSYVDDETTKTQVMCTMDDLERANDMQLHVIFQELTSLEFFQHFVVDLDHKCPLSSTDGRKGELVGNEKDAGHGSGDHSKAHKAEKEQEDHDEFHCDGGADELDEDAEPLCTVDTGGDETGLFGGAGDPSFSSFGNPVDSNVLRSLSQTGFSSNTQRDAFKWNDQTDIVVQEEEPPCDGTDGGDLMNLPDSFWMDMCSNIHEGDGTKIVNLALNPERNTGYNGTHIWKAIYEENCIDSVDGFHFHNGGGDGGDNDNPFESTIEASMCLEERVLYRLLSGMHTSTTLSIAQNYYPPSKRKNRTDWEANPQYFMEKFQDHPEYIRNLHFSYVVLLRAIKKASNYLQNYEIHSGNVVEDEASSILMKRLLDTSILRSCSNVFSAFDESVMFSQEDAQNNRLLQQSFKGVFHNISSILDCVQCQQCKLHGKLHMLGYGTALKILFVQDIETNLKLERNEVVALLNTAARLSESLMQVRELTMMYWQDEQKKIAELEVATEASPGSLTASSGMSWDSLDALDVTVSVIASLGREGLISMEREKELIELAFSRDPDLLILGRHYYNDPERFVILAEKIGNLGESQEVALPAKPPDAIVVGTGLAGLAAALNVLDRDGSVVLLEKEHLLGGNSNKASSGINGCCPQNDTYNDSLEAFRNDTIKSAGPVADLDLINVLVSKSEEAILWLRDRAHVDLSLVAQLGGHTSKRTHRPSNGMAGAEIIYNLQKAVRKYEDTGRLKIFVDTRVKKLLTDENDDDRVIGVHCENTKDGTPLDLYADNVILATGGFASDRSRGSYLDQYRPELMTFPATAGSFSTGDGVTLATALGAATRDMDKVQIHPTGWVDPADPDNPTKILAAELMRGVGGKFYEIMHDLIVEACFSVPSICLFLTHFFFLGLHRNIDR